MRERRLSYRNKAFTLIELLLTLGVLLVLFGIFAPGWFAANSSRQFFNECTALELFLREVQQTAFNQRLHCFVGFAEVPRGSDSHSTEGPNELWVAAYARGDALAGFSPSDPRGSWQETTVQLHLLSPIRAIQHYPALRLARSLPPPLSGGLARPDVSRFQRVGHPQALSVTPFDVMTDTQSVHFEKVVHLSPDGSSRIVHQTTADTLVHYVEIGLLPALRFNQSTSPPPDSNNKPPSNTAVGGLQAAIQISGISGRVRLFTP